MSNKIILFDLDGTLIDTAPDLVLSLNKLLKKHNLPLAPYAIARNESSNGSKGLVSLGFKKNNSSLIKEFIEIYQNNICVKSKLFPSINELLDELKSYNIQWGVVTNKPKKLTEKLLSLINLSVQPSIVVCGDELPKRKPDPMQIEFAINKLNINNNDCIYVGDALRDIQAGKAAGIRTIAVRYGYIRVNEDPYNWQADIVINKASSIIEGIKKLGFIN